jgi:5,6,7,8-tetrahydromethanopterin hydro-lyase
MREGTDVAVSRDLPHEGPSIIPTLAAAFQEKVRMSMYIGEALVGEGNEISHIDLTIGDKDGPVGQAFAQALANQSAGHSNLLAVLEPNLAVKPATVMVTKVTIKGAKQAVQMFGPAQYAVAKAVADSVEAGVIPKDQAEDLVIVCGVFIHWEAEDDKKIFEYNYEATKQAIASAMQGNPSVDEMLAKKDAASHPFSGV